MGPDRTEARPLSVRDELRNATATTHERLHQAPPFRAIGSGTLRADAYGRLLGQIHAFHTLVDRRCPRLALLRSDLADVGAPAAEPPRWAPPSAPTAMLGCRWVALGSAIGGKLLYRQLDYLFGASSAGRRYFLGSGEEARQWRALCLRLEEEGDSAAARDQLIAGARSAFALFETCIAEPALA